MPVSISLVRDLKEMVDLEEELGEIKCALKMGKLNDDHCVRGRCQIWQTRTEVLRINRILRELTKKFDTLIRKSSEKGQRPLPNPID